MAAVSMQDGMHQSTDGLLGSQTFRGSRKALTLLTEQSVSESHRAIQRPLESPPAHHTASESNIRIYYQAPSRVGKTTTSSIDPINPVPQRTTPKSRKKKPKHGKHSHPTLSREDQLALPNSSVANNTRGGIQHVNKGNRSDDTNLLDIDLSKDEPLSKRAARRQRARERKAAQESALFREPGAEDQLTGSHPSHSGSTATPKAPQPEHASREERALEIYSKKYATGEKASRRRTHPPRPQPPAVPRSSPALIVSNPSSSSSQVPRRSPISVEGAKKVLPATYASLLRPRQDLGTLHGRRGDNRSRPLTGCGIRAETTQRPDYGPVLQPAVSRTNPYPWIPQPQPQVSNILPCLICFDSPDEYPSHLPSSNCLHESNVCAPCLEAHICHAVQSEGLTTFRCPDPDCREVILYEDALRGLGNNTACLERYEALLLREILKQDPNFIWCKNAACDGGQIHESGALAPIVTCQICETRSCFTHDMPWHSGLTCEQYDAQRAAMTDEQERATQAYINGHTKRCPSCDRLVEKEDGCDHMTCKPFGCGHQFCWLCLADYSPIRWQGNHRHRTNCKHYRPESESSGCVIC